MSQYPNAVNPELTAIAVGFINPDANLIADRVLPLVPTAQTFQYTVFDTAQAYTVPNTLVGRKSYPNEVEFGSTVLTDKTADYALDDFVPSSDMEVWAAMPKNAGVPDPKRVSTLLTTSLISLAREIRAAGLVFNASNYAAGLQQTLAGVGQWSDYANSNPVQAILAAADGMLRRPNKLVIGRAAFSVLRQHPKVVASVFPISQTGNGKVSAAQLAEALELDEVIVGEGFVNIAKPGAAANMQRVWGKNAALIFSSETEAQYGQPTFGWTAKFGNREVREIQDAARGVTGGTTVRVIERVKELITAKEAGYYFQNCVA